MRPLHAQAPEKESKQMHINILTRGIKHDVERFITDLQGKYMPMMIKGEPHVVALAVRPIQLWELVFPEEHYSTIARTIDTDCKRIDPKVAWALRKGMKLQKMPKIDEKAFPFPVYKNNIEVVPLGVKKDVFRDGHEWL